MYKFILAIVFNDVHNCSRARIVAGRSSELQELAEAILIAIVFLMGAPLRRLCISSIELCGSRESPKKIREVLTSPVDAEFTEGKDVCSIVFRELLTLPGFAQGVVGLALAMGGLAVGLYVAYRMVFHGVFHWVLALLAAFVVTWGVVLFATGRVMFMQRVAARLERQGPKPNIRLLMSALVAAVVAYVLLSRSELAAAGAYLLVAVALVVVVAEYLLAAFKKGFV